MSYKSVVATRRGRPEVLQVVENELREPKAGQARIQVLAAGVGGTDINYRYGYSLFSPRAPFVPGYEIMGVVDAIGQGVTRVKVGDRVAALIGHGGYTEVIYLGQEHLVSVPDAVSPEDAVTLVLNYATAYQMLHRVARVKPGEKALIAGASGGVGTALLQLGKLAGLTLYGTASPGKFPVLVEQGAIPLDYHDPNWIEQLLQKEPSGLDFAFDGTGSLANRRGLSLLRRGGKLVTYPAPNGFGKLLRDAGWLGMTNLLPNGKSAEFFGITALYMRDKKPFMEDMPVLFNLLQEGKIKPVISHKLPLLEARKANELLESGRVSGNIVLLSPEEK
jgi:NADPH:quinone reductase-like Zn-dependent oxidoreductase